jgi:hypothetical protein
MAWSLVPTGRQARFRLYAYALHPVAFFRGKEQPMEFASPDVMPCGAEFTRVGWDVVSRSTGGHFECSPLSCNLIAEEVATNRYCLFSELESALDFALTADARGCEPGPYHIVEVWLERAEVGDRARRLGCA